MLVVKENLVAARETGQQTIVNFGLAVIKHRRRVFEGYLAGGELEVTCP